MVSDEVWKLPAIVDRFLSYRAAIPLAQEQIGVMISILKTRQEPVENFLDLGCGDGILGAAILGEYPSARGVLVDFSEPMLEQAREQLEEYEAQLSFENLDYGDSAWVNKMQALGPFDAIVSGYSIHHQPDERKQADLPGNLLAAQAWRLVCEHRACIFCRADKHRFVRRSLRLGAPCHRRDKTAAHAALSRLRRNTGTAPIRQPTSFRQLRSNATGCVRSVMKKSIVTSASMNLASSQDASQIKNRKSKIGNLFMPQFTTLTSRVVPLPMTDVDTDQIIPAQFLKITDKNGLADVLFFHWRFNDDGSPKMDFVINKPESKGAHILLAGDNFGCGSSREHAPWALTAYGFRGCDLYLLCRHLSQQLA